MWQVDRDGSMFTDKKQADEHDKMLELAEALSDFIDREVAGLDEEQLENIGIALAKQKDALVKACKGKPGVLSEVNSESDEINEEKPDNVAELNTKAVKS